MFLSQRWANSTLKVGRPLLTPTFSTFFRPFPDLSKHFFSTKNFFFEQTFFFRPKISAVWVIFVFPTPSNIWWINAHHAGRFALGILCCINYPRPQGVLVYKNFFSTKNFFLPKRDFYLYMLRTLLGICFNKVIKLVNQYWYFRI